MNSGVSTGRVAVAILSFGVILAIVLSVVVIVAQKELARGIADGKVRIEVYVWPDGKRDVRIVKVKQDTAQ